MKTTVIGWVLLLISCGLFIPPVASAATNVWQGGAEPFLTEWSSDDNWSTGEVPAGDDGRDVVIPAGCNHYPVLTNDVTVDGRLKIEEGAKLTLSGYDLSLGRLPSGNEKGITVEGVLDASRPGSVLRVGSGGFVNTGTIHGYPTLTFESYTRDAVIATGNAVLDSLNIDVQVWGKIKLEESLRVKEDFNLKSGVFDTANHTLTIGGSLFVDSKDGGPTVIFRMGEESTVVFDSDSEAVLSCGTGVEERVWAHNVEFQNITVDKPDSVLTVVDNPVAVNGRISVKNGRVEMADGGELWLGVKRDRGYTTIYDVALKLSAPVTPEVMPDIEPADVPDPEPGEVRIIHNQVGPSLPEDEDLSNIAAFAEITTVPYTTMVGNLVDPDEELRTLSRPERGTPGEAKRYEFRYDRPQKISRISWSVPIGGWVLLADTTGDGEYERLLRMDAEGKVENPGGTWVSRAWLHNNFHPAVEAYGIKYVALTGGDNIYDFQILVREGTENFDRPHPHEVMRGDHQEEGVAVLEAGEIYEVPPAPQERQILRGFHIEPWMFGIRAWLNMDEEKRPPLNEHEPFKNFVKGVKNHGGNVLNMWPPTTWETVGEGTYEHPVLWPSEYDRHSADENYLQTIVEAFDEEGLTLMTMRRVTYAKKREEFPETQTRDEPAPYISRHSREYLNGIVREQVRSGVDGVGIGYDEQRWGAIRSPGRANEFTREVFKQRYDLPFPEKPADTESFRRWIVFAYEEFAHYLGEAAGEAKGLNPDVYTTSPVHHTLGTLWNERFPTGIAEDIVGQRAEIDFARANAYLSFQSLGHYKTALSAKIGTGANRGGGVVSLHNCPWAPDPQAQPGFYLHFPPVYMRASPVSSVIHGARMPLYWRYQSHMFHGGYDEYAAEAYSILDTMSSWGAKTAQAPRSIAVLRSRASEDWWQVRQRYSEQGDPSDQIRGYVYLKNIMELLLQDGYPFDVHYLDHPQELSGQLEGYDLIILPFPYSVSREAAQVLEETVAEGVPMMVFDRRGETNQWGDPYPEPILNNLLAQEEVIFIDDQVPLVGHHRDFRERIRTRINDSLGENRVVSFNSYGNDVEFAVLKNEKGGYLLTFINWTDRDVEVDAGLQVLSVGQSYSVLQRDNNQVRRLSIGGREELNADDLKNFRLPLEAWEVKVLYVAPSGSGK